MQNIKDKASVVNDDEPILAVLYGWYLVGIDNRMARVLLCFTSVFCLQKLITRRD